MAAASGSTASEDKMICSRGHWRPGEDEKLRWLVEQFGPQNWNSISLKLEGRSGKSCRLRWFNQLDPRINRRPFTEEEEERLLAAHRSHGNKWALIARLFPGRTDNAVKNHWHVMKARRQRERRRHLIANRGAPHHHLFASSLNRIDFSSPSPVDLRAPAFTFSVHPFDQKKLAHDFGMVSNEDEGSREGDHVPFIDFLGVGVIT